VCTGPARPGVCIQLCSRKPSRATFAIHAVLQANMSKGLNTLRMFNTNSGHRPTGLVYDARVRLHFATWVIVAGALFAMGGRAQEDASLEKSAHADSAKSEPKYDQTFSGPIVEVTATHITVSRSILGKPAEKRTFWIKSDTRIEGKLRVRVKVTVGYVTSDDGDVARLVVVRTSQKPAEKK